MTERQFNRLCEVWSVYWLLTGTAGSGTQCVRVVPQFHTHADRNSYRVIVKEAGSEALMCTLRLAAQNIKPYLANAALIKEYFS